MVGWERSDWRKCWKRRGRKRKERSCGGCQNSGHALYHSHNIPISPTAPLSLTPLLSRYRVIESALGVRIWQKETTAPDTSRIIANYSTMSALTSLTLEIRRDPVGDGRYGRS
jgi:hypothetical protein